ncbi:response regulator transcription factor [Streptomyces sp. E1N211]|uniref:response regulator n=1 Tax=Streptomyces sp. E1N211 TaxID=1851876 RepID=UPI001F4D76FD|nr:response regulator transcription factor [Streptomyces sp. E1N211]
MLVRTGLVTIIGAQPDMEVAGECADGRAAVDLARKERPDVVVMDVRMPVLDGIEATRLLAGSGVRDPVKVLVVTTFNLDEYVYRSFNCRPTVVMTATPHSSSGSTSHPGSSASPEPRTTSPSTVIPRPSESSAYRTHRHLPLPTSRTAWTAPDNSWTITTDN